MISFLILPFVFYLTASEECGPLGYEAKTLLSPNYWYFDLKGDSCPPLPAGSHATSINATCRIYFNLCKKLSYQCSGAVCVRYTHTTDLVSLLGEYDKYPFTEPVNEDDFIADYTGEKLKCKNANDKVKTRFYFLCDSNGTWVNDKTGAHGGSRAPQPLVSFDDQKCQLTLKFNYTGACWKPGPSDSIVKDISLGTFAIILFFPGVLLYFLMGVLYNRSRGIEGADAIPHRQILEDLPELILDGFMFTVSMVTCSHEDRYARDYEEVSGTG